MGLSRKLIAIGLLFLATLATGFWRGNAGSPAFPGLLHKLLGLASAIYATIVVYRAGRPVESKATFFSAIVVLAVSMLALIATGSLLIAGGVTVRLLILSVQ